MLSTVQPKIWALCSSYQDVIRVDPNIWKVYVLNRKNIYIDTEHLTYFLMFGIWEMQFAHEGPVTSQLPPQSSSSFEFPESSNGKITKRR